MEINGIKIRDMKDVQDVLMALETIKIGIENLSDNMSRNYSNYSSISSDISASILNQKELIEAISSLQIKEQKLYDSYHAFGLQQKDMNAETISTLKKEFVDFDRKIKSTIADIVNSIDTTRLQNQIDTMLFEKVENLKEQTSRLQSNNQELDRITTQIQDTTTTLKNDIENEIKSTKYTLKSSIEEFNRLASLVNLKVVVSVFAVGVFSGALAMMFFGLNISKEKIYSQELQAITEYKEKTTNLEKRYIAASELERVAREYGIKFIQNEKGKYVLIPAHKVEDSYKSDAAWQVWKLY